MSAWDGWDDTAGDDLAQQAPVWAAFGDLMAGALGDEVGRVAQVLVDRGTVRIDVAETVLRELRG